MTLRLLVVGCLVGAVACGKNIGTETGNPPVVTAKFITVEAIDAEHVRVSGAAGAVRPGGGEVAVTNTTRDGAAVTADVAGNGSFGVELEGDMDDAYAVVAKNAAGSSPPRTVRVGMAPSDWQTLHACAASDPSSPLSVTALAIEAGTLNLDVAHGGGCAEHAYGLCFDEVWDTSLPLQVGFKVLHDDGGDACDAIESAQLSFDLAPFRQAYAQRMGGSAGAATLGFDECTIEGEPQGACSVLYEWGDAMADCGPPIGPACPAFEIPEAPATWVVHPTACPLSFRGPADLMDLDVQGVDSCVDQFDNDTCTFHVGSGAFSNGLTGFDDAAEAQVGRATIDGYDAKVVSAVLTDNPFPFVAGVHFPDPPFAPDGGSFDVTADLTINCTTREQRDAMLAALGTVTFD